MKIYLIYRKSGVDNKEIPYWVKSRTPNLYGWTSDKNVLKVFFQQRSKNKYIVRVIDNELFEKDLDNATRDELVIQQSKLQSNRLEGEFVPLFMTKEEHWKMESSIVKYLSDLSSLSNISETKRKYIPIQTFIEMLNNITYPYAEALHTIGYRPPEIDAVYDHPRDDYYDYTNYYDDSISGLWSMDPGYITTKSLEMAIIILRDDL